MVGVLNFQSCGLYGVKVANDDNLKEGFFKKTLFESLTIQNNNLELDMIFFIHIFLNLILSMIWSSIFFNNFFFTYFGPTIG